VTSTPERPSGSSNASTETHDLDDYNVVVEHIEIQVNEFGEESVVSGTTMARSSGASVSITSHHSGSLNQNSSSCGQQTLQQQQQEEAPANPVAPTVGAPLFDHTNKTPRISNQKSLWSASASLASSLASSHTSANSLSAAALSKIREMTEYISPATSEADDTCREDPDEGYNVAQDDGVMQQEKVGHQTLDLNVLVQELRDKTGRLLQREEAPPVHHNPGQGPGYLPSTEQSVQEHEPQPKLLEMIPSTKSGDDDSSPPPSLSSDKPNSSVEIKRPIPMQLSNRSKEVPQVEEEEVAHYCAPEPTEENALEPPLCGTKNQTLEGTAGVMAVNAATVTADQSPQLPSPPAPPRHSPFRHPQMRPVSTPEIVPQQQLPAGADIDATPKAGPPPRAMTPVMRMRIEQEAGSHIGGDVGGVEEAKVEVDIIEAGNEEIVGEQDAEPSIQTHEPEGATGAEDEATQEESIKSLKQQQWKKKKKIAERKREQERRSLGGGKTASRRRSSRRRYSSAASYASSRMTRDDDTAYSVPALSCQALLKKLIETRCGNLDDTISLYDDTSDEEDDDESVGSYESDSYIEHRGRKKEGRVVSFDDESDDETERRQRVLLHKRKQQDLQYRSGRNEKDASRKGRISGVVSDSSDAESHNSTERHPIEGEKSHRMTESPQRGTEHRKAATALENAEAEFHSRVDELSGKPVLPLANAPQRSSSRTKDRQEIVGRAAWKKELDDVVVPQHVEKIVDGDILSDKEVPPEPPQHLVERREGTIQRIVPSVRRKSGPTREQIEFDQVDMHDRNFIKAFVAVARTSGISLLYHTHQRRHAFTQPARVNVFIRFGVESHNGYYSEPKLVWETEDSGVTKGAVELFDIRSLDKASAIELESYPLAMPGRSLVLRTTGGESYAFESTDEQGAIRFVHGIRWVVARLTFNLIIGNLTGSCELLDVPKLDNKMDGSDGLLPQSKAMNDVANHLVDKSSLNSYH